MANRSGRESYREWVARQLAELRESSGSGNEEIIGMINDLTESVTTLNVTVDNINTAVGTISTAIDDLETRVSALENIPE